MARKTGSYSEITGPRIRASALRLFAHHGYAAVSMRRIATDVGLQAGTLYSYTPDKQSLLFDLMHDHLVAVLDAWHAAQGGGPAAKRLENFTRFHISYHIDRPDEVFVSYMELRNLTHENFQIIEALRRKYEDVLEDILTAGQRDKSFHVLDTKLAALAIIAMLTGVNTWYRADGRLQMDDVATAYCDMALKVVGG